MQPELPVTNVKGLGDLSRVIDSIIIMGMDMDMEVIKSGVTVTIDCLREQLSIEYLRNSINTIVPIYICLLAEVLLD